MDLKITLSLAIEILFGAALFVIPYLISKWFIMKDYMPKPVLYKTTSKWNYLKGSTVSIILGAMFFLGGGSSNDYDTEGLSISLEQATAFFIVMLLGGLIGVLVSHHRIRDLNEKEYYDNEKINKLLKKL